MTGEKLVNEFLAAWNAHDVDAITELYADDALMEDPLLDPPIRGRAAIALYYDRQWRESPRSQLKQLAFAALDDCVVWLWSYEGSDGEGRPFTAIGATHFALAQGRIQRDRAVWNQGPSAIRAG